MRACDGAIFATDWLARQFRGAARTLHVCRNGLDLERFAVSRVERPAVHIGWAGAFASHVAMAPWLGAVKAVLQARPDTRFVSIGADFGPALADIAAERQLGINGSMFETYPAAMSLLDIALAPTDGSRAFRAKSDLRFLEYGAVGAATVGDPRLYGTIEHGVTGLHARTPTEVRDATPDLVDDAALRRRIGDAAQAYVRERAHGRRDGRRLGDRAVRRGSAEPHVADRAAAARVVDAAGDLVGGVALDRLDAAVGQRRTRRRRCARPRRSGRRAAAAPAPAGIALPARCAQA